VAAADLRLLRPPSAHALIERAYDADHRVEGNSAEELVVRKSRQPPDFEIEERQLDLPYRGDVRVRRGRDPPWRAASPRSAGPWSW
jgi:hypothetical protein